MFADTVKVCAADEDGPAKYAVSRIATQDGAVPWSDEAWERVEPIELHCHMGKTPEHFPRVRAKIAYDTSAIYVAFFVNDRYVRAVAEAHQGAVYCDSCVEFFFTPSEVPTAGYFNLEMNCGGTMLLHFQREPRGEFVALAAEDIARIDVLHNLPRFVQPEIEQPTDWSVAYRLPVDVVAKYFPGKVAQPRPGVTWRANLYKCADETSHPHWLTWSRVGRPQPEFHRPEWFGTLVFE